MLLSEWTGANSVSCKPCAAGGNALLATVGKAYSFGGASLKFTLLLTQEVKTTVCKVASQYGSHKCVTIELKSRVKTRPSMD